MEKKIPTKLPKFLHKHFWDSAAEKINPAERPEYVIKRLLARNSLQAVRWVITHFPKDQILETIKTSRDFPEADANFWSDYYELPKEEVLCIRDQSSKLPEKIWPY